MHEVTTLNCNMMIILLWCVTTEARELPTNDEVIVVDEFLEKFKLVVPKQHRYGVLEGELRTTPTRWWSAHHKSIGN